MPEKINDSIIEETERIPPNTKNIAEVAERNALVSLSSKGRNIDMRRNELNLMGELKKYRRSEEMRPPVNVTNSKRKAKSF